MSRPGKERFLFGSAILMLAVYCAVLTYGLYRVQHNAEELAVEQRATLAAADQSVQQLRQYVETYHGNDAEAQKEQQRIKVMLDEHEARLFLLQDTINQLYALPE